MTTKTIMLGADRRERALEQGVRDLEDMSPVHERAAGIVSNDARSRTPRRTGRLASTVRHDSDRTSFGVYAGNQSTPYANAIHWGWRAHNIEPQPFITDAIEANEPRIEREYEQYNEAIVQRCAGGPM